MFTEKIPSWTQELVGLLGLILPDNCYLAGGTALALHLNHRPSYDLDVFYLFEFNETSLITRLEKKVPNFQLVSRDWQTVVGSSRDTELSFFYYPYHLLEDPTSFNSIPCCLCNRPLEGKFENVRFSSHNQH